MTQIQWTDETWNPIVGCAVVSPGCTNCYAMREAWRLANNPKTPQYKGLTKKVNGKAVWTGDLAVSPTMTKPHSWRRPRRVFVNSMGDLFHENAAWPWIDQVFAIMAFCQRHTFQVLTKRPEHMRRYLTADGTDYAGRPMDSPGMGARDRIRTAMVKLRLYGDGLPDWPLPNVWLGTSIEDQTRADERIPALLDTPVAVRFLSCEPLLGPVDLFKVKERTGFTFNALSQKEGIAFRGTALDWVIVGGESGPGARPCDIGWIRSVLVQCRAAGTPCFIKQLGSKPYVHDTRDPNSIPTAYPLCDRKGGTMREWPADLRVRESPQP